MAIQYSEDLLNAMNLAEERVGAHVVALGDLCMSAGGIDPAIDRLFEPLLQCSPAQVACLMTNVESLPPRCEMLKRLIYLEQLEPSEMEWRTWFSDLMDRVSNEICSARNRFIHDHWRYRASEGDLVKKNKKAKLYRAPPAGNLIVEFGSEEAVNTQEVEKLVMRIHLVIRALSSSFESLTARRDGTCHLAINPQLAQVTRPFARYSTLREREQAKLEGRTLADLAFD